MRPSPTLVPNMRLSPTAMIDDERSTTAPQQVWIFLCDSPLLYPLWAQGGSLLALYFQSSGSSRRMRQAWTSCLLIKCITQVLLIRVWISDNVFARSDGSKAFVWNSACVSFTMPFFSPFHCPSPVPEMDVSASQQWVGLSFPTPLLLLLAQQGPKWTGSSSRHSLNEPLLNLRQLEQ